MAIGKKINKLAWDFYNPLCSLGEVLLLYFFLFFENFYEVYLSQNDDICQGARPQMSPEMCFSEAQPLFLFGTDSFK